MPARRASNMRLPMTLTPVRSYVARAMSLSMSFLAALAELEVLPEPPLREQPRLQLRPLRHPALDPRVVLPLGREDVLDGHGLGRHEAVERHRHAEEHLPGHQPSAPWLRSGELGDVGRQVAQGLLAALDRVVLLHRLVAEFLGGEHRAHHDPGLLAGRLEGQDRLEGVRVVAGLAVQQRDPLRRDDLPPGDPLLVVGPVRPVHHEVPGPADAELEGPRRGREPFRSPPPRQVPDLRERLEHQLPRGADHPGDHDLAVRGRVRGLAATGRRHPVVPPAFLLQLLHVLVQPVEAPAPEPLEAAHPLVDRPQPAGVQAVQPLLARPADPHEPDLPEHPQVLGRLRLGHPQVPRQLGHRPLAAPQQHQDLPPLRLGDRVERVRGRRRSCHGAIICLYRNASTVQLDEPGAGLGRPQAGPSPSPPTR